MDQNSQAPPQGSSPQGNSPQGNNDKSMGVAYALWFFLGGFGVHRMYMGKMGSGLGMLGLWVASAVGTLFLVGLLGFAALGVWWVVDAILINKWFKESQQFGGQVASDQPQQSMGPPPMSNAA